MPLAKFRFRGYTSLLPPLSVDGRFYFRFACGMLKAVGLTDKLGLDATVPRQQRLQKFVVPYLSSSVERP
jgi:hypothetical protein